MEEIKYQKDSQRNIEKLILIIFTVYGIGMFVDIIKVKEEWLPFGILLVLISSWIVFIGKYRDYRFRAMFTTVMIQISINLYAIHMEDISPVLFLFITLIILVGLYGIIEVIVISVISSILLFFYHGIILQTIGLMTKEDMVQIVFEMANVFFIEFLLYFWVSKRDESSEQFMKTIAVLKEAERSKNDFLANVSHEIRTPINTICGMSEIVLQEENLQKIREDVFDIQTAGRNLMSVVSDILDFSELQSEKMEIVEEAYNITSTINDVINMTMARKNEKNIELIVDCDAHIPCGLLGDEKKIRRVIMNIVNNAIKFTDEGCVTIIIEHRKEEYGINLSVTVKDTGIGMKEESVEKLFSSFNQVDTKRNRQNGGIGLGLNISQAIVRKMGGIITVKSKLGKGSVVKFVIPQKVLDERPITSLQNREEFNLAIYIDMEQFDMIAIRDEYTNNIKHMVEQHQVKCHMCRNLAELKRREEHDKFTHIFISTVEYREEQAYFDELALRTKVIVIFDRRDEKYITNPNLLRIFKPFYILPIVSILNGKIEENAGRYVNRTEKFIAPDVHILVVDDNVMNIKVIEGLLENYQIKVSTAFSGHEALEKIEELEYDFVFMDHMMPEMDGIETLHRIRSKVGSYFQKVPIIALTANAIAGTREMFLAEGFADFVEKPVELSVLERVLKRNLPKKKLIFPGKQEEKEPDGVFRIGDLDVEKGILYCGGKEQYIKILQLHSSNADATREQIESLYEQQNWKEYTIAVHAVKSSMLSIGAIQLSELAKKLEFAGKEGNTEYIFANHQSMLVEFDRVSEMLKKNDMLCQPKVEKQITKTLPELRDSAFEQEAIALEDAMYELDGKRMLEILSELEKYQYHGTALEEPLMPIKRKVEMSDYMSAVEAVLKLKDKLKRNGEGDEKR